MGKPSRITSNMSTMTFGSLSQLAFIDTKENIYVVVEVIAQSFYFVSMKLRNTQEQLFLTGPQRVTYQVRTYNFGLGLCEDLVRNNSNRRLTTFSDGVNRKRLSGYFYGVEWNPTPQYYGGETPKLGFTVFCLGKNQTHHLSVTYFR